MKAVLALFANACTLLASALPCDFMRGTDVSSLAQVEAVRAVEGGAGVFYWEPAWLPNAHEGSTWENQTLFDFKGRALKSIDLWEGCQTNSGRIRK